MSKTRLETLEASLAKKNQKLDDAYEAHFSDVKRANGQPLNDKRNGQATLSRWGKQTDRIRGIKSDIEKTEGAISRERLARSDCEAVLSSMPPPLVDLVRIGTLIQWRKHPNTFFVEGVDKARIQYRDGKLTHKFVKAIRGTDQWGVFRDVFNSLKNKIDGWGGKS